MKDLFVWKDLFKLKEISLFNVFIYRICITFPFKLISSSDDYKSYLKLTGDFLGTPVCYLPKAKIFEGDLTIKLFYLK